MNLGLNAKVAIVGGASQGIGFGIARMLAGEGAKVAITARREADLLAAAERLRGESGVTVLPIAADVRKAEDCQRVVATVKAELGGIDILVNNDGAPPLGPILSFDDSAWQKAVEQNLLSVVRMVREVVPSMKERGGGSILNITALSAIQPIPGFALSVATWAGVIGYAKTLSLEVGPDNITVNTICPGRIDTPLSQRGFARAAKGDAARADELFNALVLSTPMRRIGIPEDIASAVAFLASPQAGFITGVTLPIDGGRSAALM